MRFATQRHKIILRPLPVRPWSQVAASAAGFRHHRFGAMTSAWVSPRPKLPSKTGPRAQMIPHRNVCTVWGMVALLAGAGCALVPQPKAKADADLAAEIIQGPRPASPDGTCFATDETPAVIETVTDQIAQGATASQDAGYITQTRQNIIQPRAQIWFRAPCDAELTPDVIATLQRALAARGLYSADPTGMFDPATRAAIRAYQSPRGLNSDRLSLAAARDLGVIAADLGEYR